jgi:ubiquinone/menaquinone biosynthesis C-methylase UbiE
MNQIPASKIYFGSAAQSYDKGRSGNPVTDEDDLAIRKFLQGCEPSSIVGDVPAGTGRAAVEVLASNLYYKGADVSPEMLEICRQKIQGFENFELVVSDARDLPWPDKSCDSLISFKFLKWLPNDEVVQEVLTEFRRVCKGKALLNVKIKKSKREISVREGKDILMKMLDRKRLGASARSIRKDKFEEMCQNAGWKIVEVYENPASNGIVFNYLVS